jgi:hypothetical protein
MRDPVGVWAMENIHVVTGFMDLYGMPDSPGRFDTMDCACGTHPSSFTKIKLGWIDSSDCRILSVDPQAEKIRLRAIAFLPSSNELHVINIPDKHSGPRYHYL